MEFLNWGGDHPWLFVFLLMAVSSACHGLGRIGSKTVKVFEPKDEA